MIKPKTCPFCGTFPVTGSKNPEEVGDACGFVHCMNKNCFAKTLSPLTQGRGLKLM